MAASKSVILNILGNNDVAIASMDEVEERRKALQGEGVDIPIEAEGEEAEEQLNAVGESADKTAASVNAVTDANARLADSADSMAGAADKQAESNAAVADSNERVAATAGAAADTVAALGDAQEASGAKAAAGGAEQEALATKTTGAGEAVATAAGQWKLLGLGLAAAAVVSVKAAGDFQDTTTHLVTDAGESAKNLNMVQQGILSVSADTGQAASAITDAMYHIESGGIHGAAGLSVLKIAAEGARVGGADLDTVSKTLVGTLNAYGMTSSNAAKQTQYSASMMNQLIATVGAGDMRMQDLASSLSAVAPLAAAVHIKFAQVGGAIATMTAQGMSAQQATQDLANTIRSLSNPNNVAINEMQQLGLNSQDVSKNLGKSGLSGTIDTLTQAITTHMGKSGMVLMNAFNQAKFAASDANAEIKAMPANLQSLAKGFLNGSISAQSWRTDLLALPPVQQHLMTQFATTAEKAHSFNTLLAAGGPAAQTYTAALAKMMGGATGLNTALMLSGSRAGVFAHNVATVAAAAKKGGDSVSNWGTIQSTFNFRLAQAKTSVEDLGISFGAALLPTLMAVLKPLSAFLSDLIKVPGLIKAFAIFGTALAAILITVKAVSAAMKVVTALQKAWTIATKTWTAVTKVAAAAQFLFDSAMDLNPIVLIVAGIVALVAIIVVLVIKVKVFRDFWIDVWKDVAGAARDAFDWVKNNWPLILGILTGPIGLAAALIYKNWSDVKQWTEDLFHDVVNAITTAFDDILHVAEAGVEDYVNFWRTGFEDVLHFFEALPGEYERLGMDILMGLVHGLEDAWTAVIGWVEHAASDISGVFAKVLGIFSPSTVFAEHGRNIVRGLVQGMQQSLPLVHATMGRLASATTMSTSGRIAVAAAGGAGNANSNVVRIEFAGDADGEFMTMLKKLIRINNGNPEVLGH